jgi:hypothetical protein
MDIDSYMKKLEKRAKQQKEVDPNLGKVQAYTLELLPYPKTA